MKVIELYELVKQGKKPVIKFNEGVFEWIEESVEHLMVAKIIEATKEDEDSIRFLIDLNDYETYNRSIASHDWADDKGQYTLSWFETIFYPKDGLEAIYLPIDQNTEIAFDFVDENSLFEEYLGKNKDGDSYVEWLEKEVLRLRSK